MNNDYIGLIKDSKCNDKIKDYDYYKKKDNTEIYLKNKHIIEKDNITIIFEGEIQNILELNKLLNSNNTYEDIIYKGLNKYNKEFFKYINGFYSLVIYDKLNNDLYIVRDKIGSKTIYYKYDNNNLYFSSSLKILLNEFNLEKEINYNTLANFLSFQYSSLEDTFFEGIKKVMPGQIVHYHNGKIDTIKYYEPIFTHNNSKTFEETAKDIHKIVSKTINDYETDAKSITTFLSSGVDSSYITSISKKSIDTYTIKFNDLEENEAKYSKELSNKLNKNNIILSIDSDTYFKAIKEISSFIPEPLADPSSIGMFLLCKNASEKYKTALIGEGPDEFFAGYNVYKEPLEFTLYIKIPFVIRKLISNICSILPKVRGINFLIRRGKTVEEWYIGNANIFTYKERKKILRQKVYGKCPQEITKMYYEKVKNEDNITKMQYIDINLWLVGDELYNAEMMGKYNNINLKTPFLNQELIDIALSLETKDKINKNNTKLVFRESAKTVLEDKWSNKKKLGFPVPLKNWLKEEKYYNLIKNTFESAEAKEFFKTNKIMKLLNEHKKGKKDNSRKIWTIYVFILWYQENFGGNNEK